MAARKDSPALRKGRGSPAVARALEILEFMADNQRFFGATELSRRLGIPKNTVFRILRSLADQEYALRDPVSGGFKLSTRVFVLGMRFYTRFDLRRSARPFMESLCRETEQTCQIQIPHGNRVLVLDTVNPEVQFFYHVSPGGIYYYHPNAFGKAMLAFMPEKEVKSILPARMTRLTQNTIISRSRLLRELEITRRTGLAYDNEEYTRGIFCIGAPVFNAEGNVVAGLGITGLTSWLDRDRTAFYESQVLRCACAVSKEIGYPGDFFKGISAPRRQKSQHAQRAERGDHPMAKRPQ